MKKTLMRVTLGLVLGAFLFSAVLLAEYIGSRHSDKYHRPNCRYVQMIKIENRVVFQTAQEAQQAGYVPCKVCRP